MSKGMSMAEYARHRGVSHEAVRVAVKTGRISQGLDGHIDAKAADTDWDATTNPRKGKGRASRLLRDCPGADMDVQGLTRAECERRRAFYLSEQARLSVDEQKGRLVDREAVEREVFEVCRRVRDQLLTIPDRIDALLAASSDSIVCNRVVHDEIAAVLERLSASSITSSATASRKARGRSPKPRR